MDIPTPDSVTIYPRTGEGAYTPTFGAGVASAACVQGVTTRTLSADGEDVLADLLVILPPVSVSAGDVLKTGGAWFDVVSVDRLAIGVAAHHVELLCKSRPAPAGTPETPVEITSIDWIVQWQNIGDVARVTFSDVVEFESGDYPEIEFFHSGSWYPAEGSESYDQLFLTITDGSGGEILLPEGTPWRVLTQPALISTALVVPATGTLGWQG